MSPLPAAVAARVELAIEAVPDPAAARRYLDTLRREDPAAWERIVTSPTALRGAVAVFAYSRFLADAVVREPERLLKVVNSGNFYRAFTVENYRERLLRALGEEAGATDFARFRRRHVLRILLRDVLGIATLGDVTDELSNLADAILDVAYRRIHATLVSQHGEPMTEDGRPCGFSVISLGKLGGRELNYSSDIDLMFVYGGNGNTAGPAVLTNKEFYKKLANQYTALLSSYTAEGQCYRVDLRLRPDGTLGEVCISAEGACEYYRARARDWEKQMLIKARISAGEPEPGGVLLEFVEPLIYQSTVDFRALEAVSETRQRISEKLAAKKRPRGLLDVKLTPGGIRDIEFLVQCLQRLHGGRELWVRHGGTVFALFRLRDKGFLTDAEYALLATAYQFLRYLEHRLQVDEDRQTHTLPADHARLELLARKMPPEPGGGMLNGETLRARLAGHLAAVQEIYHRVVRERRAEPVAPLVTLAERGAPKLAAFVDAADMHRGRVRFERFLEQASPETVKRLEDNPRLSAGVVDLFEHSGYFADQLLRYPELLDEIRAPFQFEGGHLRDAVALRRFYRRQMLRIQSESMLAAAPVFTTLGQTSVLADGVIAAAYRIAVNEAPPPANPAYRAFDQMMVIALGRLGMREFDLGSDADLNFVIPDADAAEQVYWTGVAERIIRTLGSYTGEGVMFVIDTRLRPNGREGDLVQTEGAYKTYFAHGAEAWEGISYMKARAIAGSLDRATRFLQELQDVDWRRYGQSMRSRADLRAMRMRLEREQGPRNPLKAGPGGYYDIDFALMYLRLREAGVFFRVLNTPERVDVIERMGSLSHQDAEFLRDAATFYRALDHGQRVSTGQTEGSLPTSPGQLEVLTSLVRRWTPARLHALPLHETLQHIRLRTRELFDRIFD
ncbi:MAG: glutamine-synthetase adenylyltransferase [Acidobacteria bacterium]|nr:glutamine-synthetase adenylyltransferase [Acidobacteriota bacterium]